MLDDLHDLLATEEIEVTVIDVDADQKLVDQYDELVPVLIGYNADSSVVRLCHYFLDPARVSTFCLSAGVQKDTGDAT